MINRTRKIITALLAISLAMSATAVAPFAETVAAAGERACCVHDDDTTIAAGCEASSSDHCCAESCDGCFMPCCAGLISLVATSVTLDVSEVSSSAPACAGETRVSAEPEAIFHPPQR